MPSALREHLGCIMQIFPHRDVDVWGVFESEILGGGRVLTLIKNLFGFETLVFVTSGILSIHYQHWKSHHMTPLTQLCLNMLIFIVHFVAMRINLFLWICSETLVCTYFHLNKPPFFTLLTWKILFITLPTNLKNIFPTFLLAIFYP